MSEIQKFLQQRYDFSEEDATETAHVILKLLSSRPKRNQIAASERYAPISRQKIKQEYRRTMQKMLKQGQV